MRLSLPTSRNAAEAFDLVADFGRLEEWEPTVATSAWVGGVWPEAGGRVHILLKRQFGGAEMVYAIDDVEPGRFVRYRGGTPRIHSVDSFTFVDRPHGAVINMESNITASGRWSLLTPVFRFGVAAIGSAIVLPALRRRLSTPG